MTWVLKLMFAECMQGLLGSMAEDSCKEEKYNGAK
jgi:hypothetical protein